MIHNCHKYFQITNPNNLPSPTTKPTITNKNLPTSPTTTKPNQTDQITTTTKTTTKRNRQPNHNNNNNQTKPNQIFYQTKSTIYLFVLVVIWGREFACKSWEQNLYVMLVRNVNGQEDGGWEIGQRTHSRPKYSRTYWYLVFGCPEPLIYIFYIFLYFYIFIFYIFFYLIRSYRYDYGIFFFYLIFFLFNMFVPVRL